MPELRSTSRLLVLCTLVLSSCNPLAVQQGSLKDENYGSTPSPATEVPPPPINTVSFSKNWPFDVGSSGDYTFLAPSIDFTGGEVKLKSSDQIDDDNSATGFGSGTFSGVVWDGTSSQLELGSASGCDGTITACAHKSLSAIYELNASWAPKWNNLVGYWKMDGDHTDSVGNNDGTINGNVTFLTAAILGSHSTHLDGAVGSYISVPDSTSLDLTTDYTLSLWIYQTDATANGYRLIDKSTAGSTDGLNFDTYGTGSGRRIRLCAGGNCVNANTDYTLNTWHHVVVSVSSNNIASLYLDGKFDGSGSLITPTLANNFDLRFGGPHVGCVNACGLVEFFKGRMDEAAIWNTGLTADEVSEIYERQSPKYSGTFRSRVMSAFDASQTWTGLTTTTNLPVIDPLLTDLKGLWRFNELLPSAGSYNDVTDYSGLGNHGEINGSPLLGGQGKIGRALGLPGSSSDFVEVADSNSLDVSTAATFSVWVYPRTMTSHTSVFQKVNSDTDASYMLYVGTNEEVSGKKTFRPHIRTASNVWKYGAIDFDASLNTWYHVVYTYDSVSGTMKGYVNGVEYPMAFSVAPAPGDLIRTSSAPLLVGKDTRGSNSFNGSIDELGIWGRVLSAAEISKLYRQGANRLKYQVRTCGLSDCSDDPSELNWKGSSGTIGSYFSEPTNSFSYTAQYFQYRAIFESDSTTLSPELKFLQVDPLHYDSSAPTIIGNSGVEFHSLSGLTETLDTGGCAGGVVYNLGIGASAGAATWYWFNGSQWVAADGTKSQANSAAVASANLGSLNGTGMVYFKAFLQSNGTTDCRLDEVGLTGLQKTNP